VKQVDISETRGGNVWKIKLKHFKQTGRTSISETSKGHPWIQDGSTAWRVNIINNKMGYLVADLQSIFNRWRNHLSQLLNVHEVNDVRLSEIHSWATSVWAQGLRDGILLFTDFTWWKTSTDIILWKPLVMFFNQFKGYKSGLTACCLHINWGWKQTNSYYT